MSPKYASYVPENLFYPFMHRHFQSLTQLENDTVYGMCSEGK